MNIQAVPPKEQAETKVYFNGLPTNIEIKTLQEAYPDASLQVGQLIPYDELEGLLGLSRRDSRFYTVTKRWRKIVETDSGKILKPLDTEGLKVLSETEKVRLSGSELRTASRKARRALVILHRTDRKLLGSDDQALYDHLADRAAKAQAIAQIKRRLALPEV